MTGKSDPERDAEIRRLVDICRSAREIAETLGLNIKTVQAFMRRNGLRCVHRPKAPHRSASGPSARQDDWMLRLR